MNIEIFKFKDRDVRIIVNENNDPEFCAADVTRILGYLNGPKAIVDHCKSDGITKRDTIDSLGRTQPYSFISEANLYRLIMKSDKPEAEPFNDWIAEEVLPSIRKHGVYATPMTIESIILNPDFGISLLSRLKETNEEKERLRVQANIQKEQLKIQAPKVEYFDEVLQSESLITTTVIAKDLGMTAQNLNKILHEKRIQYKSGKTWVPYKEYQDKGYTKSRTHHFTDAKGEEKTEIHTYWTEKGRNFIVNLLKSIKAA